MPLEPEKIRNVAVVGHRGTGKTSLVEAMLFQAGATNRLGTVEAGSTVSDWDEDEQRRQMSLAASLCHLERDGLKVNLIDTPGDAGFQGDAIASLRVVEGALVVVSGVMGVEVQTGRMWSRAEELGLSRVLFVNMLDRERADFARTLEQLQSQLSEHCVAVHLPIGSEHELTGIVDASTAAFVFKTIADPFAGRINVFRVLSGTLSGDSTLVNTRAHSKERVGQLLALQGKEHQQTPEFGPGDIGAVAKLKETMTGDLLLDAEREVEVPELGFPEPVMSFAVTPKSKGDEEKVASSLRRLAEEDPTLVLRREPLEGHVGYEFVDKIVGGVIPQSFRPAVDKGIQEAMQHGDLAGAPVQGVRVLLVDGSYHTVDSSEMAFKIAGSMAFRQAYEKAQPTLLEPIMELEVTVPDESVGAVNGDLNSRRGRLHGMEPKGGATTIKAEVPMAEVLTYNQALTSMTGGRGDYHMQFLRYEEVPAHIAQKVIDEAKKEKEEAKA